MPTPRGGLAVAVLDGRVHALGGSGERVTNAHEVYDPATNRWTPRQRRCPPRAITSPPSPSRAACGRWAGAPRSWVEQYANVEIYDPATDAWRTGAPLPVGRGGLAAAALPDRVLVFGGEAPLRIFNATEMCEVAASAGSPRTRCRRRATASAPP